MSSHNPSSLSRILEVSPRQIRYWIEQGYVGPGIMSPGQPGVELLLTKEEASRIASIATLVKCCGLAPEKAGIAARNSKVHKDGVRIANITDSVQVYWRNPEGF